MSHIGILTESNRAHPAFNASFERKRRECGLGSSKKKKRKKGMRNVEQFSFTSCDAVRFIEAAGTHKLQL